MASEAYSFHPKNFTKFLNFFILHERLKIFIYFTGTEIKETIKVVLNNNIFTYLDIFKIGWADELYRGIKQVYWTAGSP